MSISTYSELKTAVANWVDRSDLTTYVPDFIALGEARIYRELRIRAMETALNGTISSGSMSLPTSYVELKFAYVDGTPTQRLQRKTLEFIYEKYPVRSSDGKPSFIAREGSSFIFGPYPDSGYTIKGIYYARLAALSDSNTTNWFTTNAPDILLWASLAETEPFLKNDARLVVWEAKYQSSKKTIQDEDKAEQFSGGSITSSVSWQ